MAELEHYPVSIFPNCTKNMMGEHTAGPEWPVLAEPDLGFLVQDPDSQLPLWRVSDLLFQKLLHLSLDFPPLEREKRQHK
jgi:hypothetical protein